MELLIYIFLILLVINLMLFTVNAFINNDKYILFSYPVSFLVAIIILLFNSDFQIFNILIASMVILWAIRLIVYLYLKTTYLEESSKKVEYLKKDIKIFFGYPLIQSVFVIIILLPVIFYYNIDLIEPNILAAMLGFVIWAIGLYIEHISDIQKYNFFKNKKTRKNKWIDKGLWGYSRHPNYFGEILVWIGIYIFTFNFDIFPLIAIISPVLVIILLRYVTGVPFSERILDNQFRSYETYKEYKRETNLIIPKIPKN